MLFNGVYYEMYIKIDAKYFLLPVFTKYKNFLLENKSALLWKGIHSFTVEKGI